MVQLCTFLWTIGRTIWEDTSISPGLKLNFCLAREDRTLLWFARLHFSDQKRLLRWIHMNRTHRLHGGARLKLRIILPVNQIFTTCLWQNMPFIQSYKNLLSWLWSLQSAQAKREVCCKFYPQHTETSIKYGRKYISAVKCSSLVLPQTALFRVAAFRCVHLEARLQINEMTSSCGSLSFI